MSRPPCLGPNLLTIKVSSFQIKKNQGNTLGTKSQFLHGIATSILMPENYDRF